MLQKSTHLIDHQDYNIYIKEELRKRLRACQAQITKKRQGMQTQDTHENTRIEGERNGRWCAIMQNAHHQKKRKESE